MSIADMDKVPADYLLSLVKKELKENIKAELIKDLDPIIEAAAVRTIESLELYVVKHVDNFKSDYALQLVINKKEVPHGSRS